MRVIDCHCHVYPQAVAARAVKGVADFYEREGSFGDGLASSVRSLWKEKGVDHAVIFSVATKLSQVDNINSFISSAVAEGDGFFTGLGTVHQDVPDMGQAVEAVIGLGLKGIKLHPETQGVAVDDPRLLSLYEACADRIPVLIHTGDYRYDCSNPDRMARVLRLFPHNVFIGAHYGGWSVWDEAADKLHGFDNFFVDSSSTFHWVDKDRVRGYIRTYGSEKVMFGSDFPMWDVRPEIDGMLSLGLSDSEYEDIFHRTAEKLFGI